MESRETSVKYQFDKEMVQFVKQLEIKTTMFGYDKTDVYRKFKDLLIRARSFCDDAVEKERIKIADLEQQLSDLKGAMLLADQKVAHDFLPKDNDAADESRETIAGARDEMAERSTTLQEKSEEPDFEKSNQDGPKQEFAHHTDEESDTLSQGQEDVERFKERFAEIQEQNFALDEENSTLTDELDKRCLELETLKRALSDARKEQEALEKQLSALSKESAALKEKLKTYSLKEEVLNHTEAILDEARLEGENIVREARVRAEQELFLYRARHRDEERAHGERIALLRAERHSLEQECLYYRSYISQGENLLHEMKAYADRFGVADIAGETPEDVRLDKGCFNVCDDSVDLEQGTKKKTDASDETVELAEALAEGE